MIAGAVILGAVVVYAVVRLIVGLRRPRVGETVSDQWLNENVRQRRDS